jgi:ribosomal protein S18 acetylase RimI-like enzyme
MTPIAIKTATTIDAHQAIAVIVLSFSTDPLVRWCYPDPHQYLAHFSEFIRALAGKAFEQQTAYYVDGFSAAALWLPAGIQPDEEEMVAVLQGTVSEPLQEEVLSLLGQMGNYHPMEPHWYLPLIGVEPRQQHQGFGSALMKHALVPCDGDKKLAYLEATNPENMALYERYGFELLDTIQIGSSPPVFPMLRKPR